MTQENESEILKDRQRKVETWRKEQIDPYGERFLPKQMIGDVLSRFEEARPVTLAGRLMAMRVHGKSSFGDLRDESGKIQIYAKYDDLGPQRFEQFVRLDVGDIIGVEGQLFKSRTGEPTVKTERFVLLAKILQVLPEKWHGLRDIEIRYRRRYLDLVVNEAVRKTFRLRSEILKKIREFLDRRGFMEVETPMMQPLPGGARAKPFKTYHESLATDLYLRVAPELYLKRLLVGGFEKVYEINRNFRNEGLSVRHNPEFTMLELYQSYADVRDMMAITEELIYELVRELHGQDEMAYGERVLNFKRPWKRLSFYEALAKKTAVDWRKADIKREALRLGLEVGPASEEIDVLNGVFDVYIGPELLDPTFVMDYPLAMSPLAKGKKDDLAVADRFELYIAHMEIANAFTELNDPVEQRKRFEEQRKMIGEQKEMDEDFLLALEYGMPPAGGLGIGIDRLVMLLTNQHSIRDVVLFPQLRPLQKSLSVEPGK